MFHMVALQNCLYFNGWWLLGIFLGSMHAAVLA